MNNSVKKTRMISVELLRIVAMFLVVACHAMIHMSIGLNNRFGSNAGTGWGVAAEHVVVQFGQDGVSILFIKTGYILSKKSLI